MSAPTTQAIHISTPKCEPGIGKIIRTPESADLIEGVRVRAYDLWPDDRGYFLEVVRIKQGLAADFRPGDDAGLGRAQLSGHHQGVSLSPASDRPVGACAGHVPGGAGRSASRLVHLRVKNTLYTGALKPWQILIPPGVGHGYKVIGESAAMLIYVTNRLYDPKDEGRIPYNDPSIAYDWELQHK